jgi:hypothetical protein
VCRIATACAKEGNAGCSNRELADKPCFHSKSTLWLAVIKIFQCQSLKIGAGLPLKSGNSFYENLVRYRLKTYDPAG